MQQTTFSNEFFSWRFMSALRKGLTPGQHGSSIPIFYIRDVLEEVISMQIPHPPIATANLKAFREGCLNDIAYI